MEPAGWPATPHPSSRLPWPPAPVWQALLGSPTDAPELVWDDDAMTPNA